MSNVPTWLFLVLLVSILINGWLIGDKIKRAMWARNKRRGRGRRPSGPGRKTTRRSRYGNWPKGSKPAAKPRRGDDDDYAPRPGAPF